MCRINSYCPCGQRVSPCGVSIHIVYMVSMYRHIYHPCGKCLTICHINSYCLHGQHVLPYVARVASVSPYAICRPHGQSVSPYKFILSTWSAYCHIYRPCGQCLTICRINSYCLHGQYVLPYGTTDASARSAGWFGARCHPRYM